MLGQPGRSSIVNISSGAGHAAGSPTLVSYGAAKAGLNALGQSLAVALANRGVKVVTVAPGWFETDMTRDWMDLDVVKDRVLKRVPSRRWGQPQDFGAVAVYLASDASAYHSGDTLLIDGAYALF